MQTSLTSFHMDWDGSHEGRGRGVQNPNGEGGAQGGCERGEQEVEEMENNNKSSTKVYLSNNAQCLQLTGWGG